MKTRFFVIALTTALLAGATAGNVLAGDSMANSADPESALGQAWVNQGAIETGMLPDASGGASAGSRIASGGTDITVVEVGGVRYRIGLDTGP